MKDLYAHILEHLHNGVYYTDRNRRIIYWNKAAERITGYSPAEVTGRCCGENILRHADLSGQPLCTGVCPLSLTLADGQPRQGEVYLHRKDGSRLPVSVRITPLRDDDGHIIGAVELFCDATEKVGLLRRLEDSQRDSLTDPLTGVGKRRHAELALTGYTQTTEVRSDHVGLLMLDLDRFKVINDTFGHPAGDKLLAAVAGTIRNCLRHGDSVSRWGGEEFLVVVNGPSLESLSSLAERLRTLIEASSVEHEGQTITVTVSIGGALVDERANLDEGVAQADANLYVCKKTGRNKCLITPLRGLTVPDAAQPV